MIEAPQGVTFPESGSDSTGKSDLAYFAQLAAGTYVASQQTRRPSGSVAVAEKAGPSTLEKPAGIQPASGGSILWTVGSALVAGLLVYLLTRSALWAMVIAAIVAIAVAYMKAKG